MMKAPSKSVSQGRPRHWHNSHASAMPLPDGAKIVAIAVIPIDVIPPSGEHISDQFDIQDFPAHGLDD